ncbi:DUF6308 family protein [Antrihabitans sp. NCIMB 15449]|jgi:hypothetical protein|uniref:DUF6308 family protein n=1 Tax=Antrihabitans spumae TaxID=3373370 RepID=A0ABW7JW66_9NOCA
MLLTLPSTLQTSDDGSAIDSLRRYYGHPYLDEGRCYVGAYYDSWDTHKSTADDSDRFTADDLIAVTFLSVNVKPLAARQILATHADRYTDLLAQIGPDRNLTDESDTPTPAWPAWQLDTELRKLPGIGRTIASKLMARKRPQLLPIWDTVIAAVLNAHNHHLEPIRVALRHNDSELDRRLRRIRDAAGLPDQISVLRTLDVVTWMDGKARGY